MQFRAKKEGAKHTLTLDFYKGNLLACCPSFFGVVHDVLNITVDQQNPEALKEWRAMQDKFPKVATENVDALADEYCAYFGFRTSRDPKEYCLFTRNIAKKLLEEKCPSIFGIYHDGKKIVGDARKPFLFEEFKKLNSEEDLELPLCASQFWAGRGEYKHVLPEEMLEGSRLYFDGYCIEEVMQKYPIASEESKSMPDNKSNNSATEHGTK